MRREVERLRAEVEGTIAGDPWYGSPVSAVLQGIDAAAARTRPIPGAHTVLELVLHMTAWADETTRRLRGAPHRTLGEGDWPRPASGDAAAWEQARRALHAAHDELAKALLELADADLPRQVAGAQADAFGQPVTLYRTIVGLLQHDAYHTGQIALLKKLLLPT